VAETIIPTNMVSAAQKALDNLERSVGNIDEMVAGRLGYDSKEKHSTNATRAISSSMAIKQAMAKVDLERQI
jgi:hypothetical protein